jgi:hypothetical protein
MAFDLHVELHRTNELLERIASALERAVGPDPRAIGPVEYAHRKRGPEAISNYGNDERLWLKDNATNLVRERGLAPALEQELLDQTLKEYDQSVENQALDGDADDLLW